MIECLFQSRLSAFHDRELDTQTARRLEEHLDGCESCKQTLAGIRAVSRLLSEPQPDVGMNQTRMSQMGLARLHATAEVFARRQRQSFPLLRTMIAMAASIVIIAGAWLTEVPPAGTGSTLAIHERHQEPWEALASGERYHPTGTGDTGVASTDFSNWMVDHLQPVDGKPALTP